jgi:hypothetical protein
MVESNQEGRRLPTPIAEDMLNFKNDKEIMDQLAANGKLPSSDSLESLVFSTKVLKYNRFGFKQERHLLLTTQQLANIKKTSF